VKPLARAIATLPRSRVARIAVVLPVAAAVGALLYWHGPNWHAVGDAFTSVVWEWVAVAIGFNLLSVVVRALAWQRVINAAMPPPHPRSLLVFSAFSVGLFANAILPGRIGELARVAVLTRRLPLRRAWATLVGTVFAHRVFDFVPVLILIVYVLAAAKIPHWAIASLIAIVGIGLALFAFAFASARVHHRTIRLESMGAVRRIVTMARHGLGVMRAPLAAAAAIGFQIAGWVCQLLAVWTAMRAFHIHQPLAAAALVLLVMNVVTILPLWPGNNVGALQVAIAIALSDYGVPKFRGIAYGFGLQAIEASVGVGVGLLFLAREGLSVAMLRVMPKASQAEVPEGDTAQPGDDEDADRPRARARVSG
jgi:uncharacterized protein (TIRG00374 family)